MGWSEEIGLGSWNKSKSRMQLMFLYVVIQTFLNPVAKSAATTRRLSLLSSSVSMLWQRRSSTDDRSCCSRSVVSGQSQPLLPSKLVLFLRLAFQRVCTASIIICRTYASCRQID
ncbi:hypothetical protein ACQJBY_006050 [Aegilops geniculata]